MWVWGTPRRETARCRGDEKGAKTGLETAPDGQHEAAPLDFWRELPDLEAASRLPVAELAAQVAGLRQALSGAHRELAKLQAEAAAAEAAPSGEKAPKVLAPGTRCEARLGTKCYPATVVGAHLPPGGLASDATYVHCG